MRGREIKVLSDSKGARSGQFLDKLLTACVESVTDPGPYIVGENSLPNWDDVLIGDKTFLMIRIRSATFGSTFTFKLGCGSCDRRQEYDVDLDALEVKRLSAEDAQAVKSGNHMQTTLADGKTVTFRLATGKDERRAAQQKDKDDAIMLMLVNRIVSIEGVDNVRAYLDDLGLAEIMSVLGEFNKHDCGVETAIVLECPDCANRMEVELPLGPAFWIGLKK